MLRQWNTSIQSCRTPHRRSSSWTGGHRLRPSASFPGTDTEAPGRRRRMTQMNGDEATAILRSRGIRVPIIGLTGDAHPEDLESFLATGASEVCALGAPVRADSSMLSAGDDEARIAYQAATTAQHLHTGAGRVTARHRAKAEGPCNPVRAGQRHARSLSPSSANTKMVFICDKHALSRCARVQYAPASF